jgi:para-aminobenzoate synthetase component 1
MTAGRHPLIEEWLTDLSPAQVWRILCDQPGVFFLDSAMVDGRLGRYSFVGCRPFLTFESRGRRIMITHNRTIGRSSGNPFDELGQLLDAFTLDRTDLPVPFTGGAVGYFGYDAGRHLEKLPHHSKDDLKLPECSFGFYDVIYAYDHLKNRSYLISTGFPEPEESARLRRAQERQDEFKKRLTDVRPINSISAFPSIVPPKVTCNFTHDEYLTAVEQARQYIIDGDIFEVNLSQRFEVSLSMTPMVLYDRLRYINPAPFAAYLDCGGFSIVSASLERFLKLSGNIAETRPIKGTRKRGATDIEDQALAAELLASDKDRAENMMIVDLSRNDLGRVCRYGTVKVTALAVLETFPTVFHLTSTIVGELAEGNNRIDLLKAAFPGGSVTGAPKVRAMEIIDELEPTRRGIYTGAIGWLGFNGDFDLNIAIRTIVAKSKKAHFQVGGAVTFDSNPEAEYQETLHKARALFQALGANHE